MLLHKFIEILKSRHYALKRQLALVLAGTPKVSDVTDDLDAVLMSRSVGKTLR
jgi:hypothetical protein